MIELHPDVVHELIAAARGAMDNAYVPYSHFPVGAALLCSDGRIYKGCNVENASYGAVICAERSAIVSAVSDGRRDFTAIAVCAGTEGLCSPCGICRQVIMEFGADIQVIRTNMTGEHDIRTISYWLPGAFTEADLI